DTAIATLTAAITEDLTPPARAGAMWPVIEGLLRRDPAERMSAAEAEHLLMLGLPAAAAAPPRYLRPPKASARVRPRPPRPPPPPPPIPPPAPPTPPAQESPPAAAPPPAAAQEPAPATATPPEAAQEPPPATATPPAAAQEQAL